MSILVREVFFEPVQVTVYVAPKPKFFFLISDSLP
jgi:hypothetical protein